MPFTPLVAAPRAALGLLEGDEEGGALRPAPLYDLMRRERQLRGHIGPVSCLSLTDEALYSGSWDCSVRCWRRSDWQCAALHRYGDFVWSVVRRGGLLLVSAGAEVHVHDAGSGKLVRKFENLHEGHVSCLEGTHSGRLLFTGAADGLVMAHDLRMRDPSAIQWHHNAGVTGLAWEDPWLASCSAGACRAPAWGRGQQSSAQQGCTLKQGGLGTAGRACAWQTRLSHCAAFLAIKAHAVPSPPTPPPLHSLHADGTAVLINTEAAQPTNMHGGGSKGGSAGGSSGGGGGSGSSVARRRNLAPGAGPAHCVDIADQWVAVGCEEEVVRTWDFTRALEAEARAAAARAARNTRKARRKRGAGAAGAAGVGAQPHSHAGPPQPHAVPAMAGGVHAGSQRSMPLQLQGRHWRGSAGSPGAWGSPHTPGSYGGHSNRRGGGSAGSSAGSGSPWLQPYAPGSGSFGSRGFGSQPAGRGGWVGSAASPSQQGGPRMMAARHQPQPQPPLRHWQRQQQAAPPSPGSSWE